mmetsp:Transcript_633/g.1445  ORF Transcript_633/g.1445 Transcript_633/m.1445 type:complete len:137 (+) Transcript_633:301-711(+)
MIPLLGGISRPMHPRRETVCGGFQNARYPWLARLNLILADQRKRGEILLPPRSMMFVLLSLLEDIPLLPAELDPLLPSFFAIQRSLQTPTYTDQSHSFTTPNDTHPVSNSNEHRPTVSHQMSRLKIEKQSIKPFSF